MTFPLGIALFAVLTVILWWALQNQLGVGTKAHHAHHDHDGHDHSAHAAHASHAAPDDLTRIEGIGPKINHELHKAGIHSFADLAGASAEQLDAITKAAGINTAVEDSWPAQAKLAAVGKWSELDAMQEELKAGR